jgi:hypothetical protein
MSAVCVGLRFLVGRKYTGGSALVRMKALQRTSELKKRASFSCFSTMLAFLR